MKKIDILEFFKDENLQELIGTDLAGYYTPLGEKLCYGNTQKCASDIKKHFDLYPETSLVAQITQYEEDGILLYLDLPFAPEGIV